LYVRQFFRNEQTPTLFGILEAIKTGAKVIAQNLVDFEQLIAKYKAYVYSIVIPAKAGIQK
jgi:hypothetical protein